MNYGKTLNLPKTTFPMRANLSKREPLMIEKWDDIGLYKLIQEAYKESISQKPLLPEELYESFLQDNQCKPHQQD